MDAPSAAQPWSPLVIRVDDACLGPQAYASVEGTGADQWGRPPKVTYVKPSSNGQIKAICRTYTQDKFKLMYLLEKHNVKLESRAGNQADSHLYRHVRKGDDAPNPDRDRGQAAHLHYHLQRGVSQASAPARFSAYTDIGGGNGGISAALGGLVGASKVTVVDPKGGPLAAGVARLATTKPIETASQDLATCIFSMHHFDDLPGMLADIARIVKPGGILFIKEHDCWNAIDSMMVDIEHSLFMTAHGETISDTHTLHYKNHVGWAHVLATAGFKLIHQEYFCGPREEVTPTRAFVATFMRV